MQQKIIQKLLRSRDNVPEALWLLLMKGAWRTYWLIEQIKQSLRLGRKTAPLFGSERALFAEKFCSYFPIGNVLEIGAAYGQSFHLLAKLLPQTQFLGIDINPETVQAANVVIKENKITNAKIIQGDATDIQGLPDRSFDIVYSSAALLYVDDNEISQVIKEMIRISRKSIILLELHLENPEYPNQHLGIKLAKYSFLGTYWVRDYKKLILQHAPRATISLTKIPRSMWINEAWAELGYIIEVNMVID
ncbi:MAG: class I SAM-dependent methyltransferase [Deltaproteobacteria bacterium]|nr:class I SAM-dependent methyltransferase [Deltaproteobacteria bacterium]